jgi:5-methylcytosine-specific restriction enzyme subunit McrC
MSAYQKKYGAEHVTLLYPKTEQIQTRSIEFREIYDDVVTVCVRFVEQFDIHNSLATLLTELLRKEA